LHPAGILIHAEDTHLAISAAESFNAFECFLTIVQAGGGDVD
jgi:hypothetical protein